jgi:multidrug resistance efflux pump
MRLRTPMLWTTAGTVAILAVVLFPRGAESRAEPSFTGLFEQETMPVIARSGGRVREVCAREGEAVDAGRVLVRLEDGELQARYKTLRALVDRAATGADLAASLEAAPSTVRQQMIELNPEVRASEAAYVDALATEDKEKMREAGARRTAVHARVGRRMNAFLASSAGMPGELREAVKLIEAQLAESAITTPAAGSVDILRLHAGEIVLPGQPVASVAVAGRFYATLHVSQDQLATMPQGQQVEVRVGDLRAAGTGKVEHIAPDRFGDEDQPAFIVRVRVDDPPAGAIGGMKARVHRQ